MVRHINSDKIPAVYNVDEITPHQSFPGVNMRAFRGLDIFVGCTTIAEDSSVDLHGHPWEQITFIRNGECDFNIGGENFQGSEGDIFFIPPGVEHAVSPMNDNPAQTLSISPLREDFLPYTDYQEEFVDY